MVWLSTLGTLAGTAFGGPIGAAAGGAIGGAIDGSAESKRIKKYNEKQAEAMKYSPWTNFQPTFRDNNAGRLSGAAEGAVTGALSGGALSKMDWMKNLQGKLNPAEAGRAIASSGAGSAMGEGSKYVMNDVVRGTANPNTMISQVENGMGVSNFNNKLPLDPNMIKRSGYINPMQGFELQQQGMVPMQMNPNGSSWLQYVQ